MPCREHSIHFEPAHMQHERTHAAAVRPSTEEAHALNGLLDRDHCCSTAARHLITLAWHLPSRAAHNAQYITSYMHRLSAFSALR
jgi:hypothetical protein